MAESIAHRLNALAAQKDKRNMRPLLEAILADLTALNTQIGLLATREKNQTLSSAGLVIGTTSKKVPKAASPFCYVANGTLVFKAADTAMSALAGTIADAKAAGWAFYGDSAGTITTSAKTADAANAAAAFALVQAVPVPADKALIGYLVVATSGATFVGASTDLDAVTATATYVSIVGNGAASTAAASTLNTIA